MSKEETKRISFDRETPVESTNMVEQLIYDPEELMTGWERVYTVISARDITTKVTKIRFGTGDKQKVKWHEEVFVIIAADELHFTYREHHARQHNIGVVGVYGCGQTDKIVVVWHGYDKRIRER